MKLLDIKLRELKDQTIECMHLVRSQLAKSREAFLKLDTSLAQEVIHYESRVNAAEIGVDKDCERIFALFNPVAADLRFVLATLKINTQIERIGDHAYGIATYSLELKERYDEELLKAVRFGEMFETAISMIDDAIHAFNFEDTRLARWVFGKDATINEINREVAHVIGQYCKEYPDNVEKYLYLFSLMRKIERVGDLAKNIAEETIFFIEAKVLKHKGKT